MQRVRLRSRTRFLIQESAYSPVAVAAASLGNGSENVILEFASLVSFFLFLISSFYGIVYANISIIH